MDAFPHHNPKDRCYAVAKVFWVGQGLNKLPRGASRRLEKFANLRKHSKK